eukprot:6820230-Lingulodinium_polyedra.AAC.1
MWVAICADATSCVGGVTARASGAPAPARRPLAGRGTFARVAQARPQRPARRTAAILPRRPPARGPE